MLCFASLLCFQLLYLPPLINYIHPFMTMTIASQTLGSPPCHKWKSTSTEVLPITLNAQHDNETCFHRSGQENYRMESREFPMIPLVVLCRHMPSMVQKSIGSINICHSRKSTFGTVYRFRHIPWSTNWRPVCTLIVAWMVCMIAAVSFTIMLGACNNPYCSYWLCQQQDLLKWLPTAAMFAVLNQWSTTSSLLQHHFHNAWWIWPNPSSMMRTGSWRLVG